MEYLFIGGVSWGTYVSCYGCGREVFDVVQHGRLFGAVNGFGVLTAADWGNVRGDAGVYGYVV